MDEFQSPTSSPAPDPVRIRRRLARVVLMTFVMTFLAARIVVLLIMTRQIPGLYLHVKGTHVHHLNYGIFLLSFTGAISLFAQPQGKWLSLTGALYAVGLALTFDEFGMWLHLGGPYWQRASFDAMVVIAAILGLVYAAPSLSNFKPQHWKSAALIVMILAVFGVVLARSLSHAEDRLSPFFEQIEANGPE